MAYSIEIDGGSGFCFGVVNAIKKAEEQLINGGTLYCLGDIVHNNMEVDRLESAGLKTINHEEFGRLQNATVLLRAHGEPPETYRIAKENNITLVDATCPVVLHLQKKVRTGHSKTSSGGLVIIYGKKGHAEVNGLVGQTNGEAIVVEKVSDLDGLDFNQPVYLYSQTTKQPEGLADIEKAIREKLGTKGSLELHNSICRQVSGRVPGIEAFAARKDVILFVGGVKSSNGKMLYEAALKKNPRTYFLSSAPELKVEWLENVSNIGICGATSTPRWLMEEVAEKIKNEFDKKLNAL
jgi:4-hydroxy-3-methylbut-2-en-1-yl diphosphate reductase